MQESLSSIVSDGRFDISNYKDPVVITNKSNYQSSSNNSASSINYSKIDRTSNSTINESNINQESCDETTNNEIKKLRVHPFDWQVIDGQVSDELTELRAWCKDEESKTHLVRFMGFPIMAQLELPSRFDGRMANWNRNSMNRVFTYLKNALGNDAPRKYVHRKLTKLYYFQERKTDFMLLVFNNLKAMRVCRKLVQRPRNIRGFARSIKFNLHETKVSPVRKLLTRRECGISQWFEVEARVVNSTERVSVDNIYEYIGDWKTINPLNIKKVTRAGTLGIDIECNSDNIRAFPDAWNAKDISYMISCIYRQEGERDRNICIIYGIAGPPKDRDEYIFVDSEIELIRTFEEIVRKLDPDVITGYNIHGFDYPYLHKRLKRLGLNWTRMGRIKNENAELKTMSWASSGFGHNDMSILQMSGRISMDMLNVVKREHKLPKYNLDTVAKHFKLGDGKDPVSPQDMFRIVKHLQLLDDLIQNLSPDKDKVSDGTEGERIIHRVRNVHNLVQFVRTQNEKMKTYSWEEVSKIVDLINYVNASVKVVADYCLKDSILVMDLFEKLNIWIYLIELSTITGVTPMELFTRGQQARGLSVVYDLAARRGYVIDSHIFPKDKFTGGYVGDPVPGLYENSICLDFKSLYPSIIIAFNICWTTHIPQHLDHIIKDKDCNVNEWDDFIELKDDEDCDSADLVMKDGKRHRVIHRRNRFLKSPNSSAFSNIWGKNYKKGDNKTDDSHIFDDLAKQFLRGSEEEEEEGSLRKAGLLPELVGRLIDERNKVRAEQKKYKPGTIEYVILEQRQLGLKQTANSMYGLLGVTGEGAVLPLPDAAMSVTAYGRRLILYCNTYVKRMYYGHIVYGDTDSLMFTIPDVVNGLDANKWGKKLEKELSALFPDPLYLEFEKAGRQFCIAKKNYVFWIYDENGELPYDKNGKPSFMSKGIPLARRDKALWQRRIVERSLNMIIEKESWRDFLDMIIENVVRTLRGEIDWRDFIIIRGLGSGYKDKNYFMKVFAEELHKLGRPAQPGDRLEYVIVKTKEPVQLLGQRMRDIETFHRRIGTKDHEPIDYEYYIEHFLQDCIEKYWSIAYQHVIKQTMDRNRIVDYSKILVELRYAGYESQVVQALTNNDMDPERAVKALLLTPLKNKVITERRRFISGRHLFDCRLSDRPIKTLLKGFRRGRLEEAVRNLASPQMYAKLAAYPNENNEYSPSYDYDEY